MATAAPADAPLYAFRWGPSGRDTELSRSISDLTTGGYLGTTRELLAGLRGEADFDRRAYCTSVLAARIVQKRLHCDQQWVADEPKNPDARLLRARALVVRAIHAARARSESASAHAAAAAEACRCAAQVATDDPTPWVTLLALGEANPLLPELRTDEPAPDGMSVLGPWAVFGEITKRDPYNREAVHRLIPRCFAPTPESEWTPETAAADEQMLDDAAARAQVAVWAADGAPANSPLKLLRLMHSPERDPFPNPAERVRQDYFANDQSRGGGEKYRERRRDELAQRWRLALLSGAIKLAHAWFADGRQPPYMPLADLSFLAEFLYRQREREAAGLVLTWMYPHATADPWRREGDPGEVLTRVLLECNVHPRRLPR
jgi:hypothetical protein